MTRLANVDLRLLRVFVAVAKAGSYAAAQSELNLSVSTISLHMSQLEQRFGTRLCERGRGGFRLTESGQAILRETHRLFATLEDYETTIGSMRGTLSGILKIGIVDCLVTHPLRLLTDVIGHFNERRPEVNLVLEVGDRQQLEQDVLDDRLLAAIGPKVRPISGLDFKPLFEERHEVFCGRGHPLYERHNAEISNEDLAECAFVGRAYMHRHDHRHIGSIKERAFVNNLEAMAILLLTGRFIGYLPVHYAQQWVAKDELRPVLGRRLGYLSRHALITREGKKPNAVLQAFIDDLTEVMIRPPAQPFSHSHHPTSPAPSPDRIGRCAIP